MTLKLAFYAPLWVGSETERGTGGGPTNRGGLVALRESTLQQIHGLTSTSLNCCGNSKDLQRN